MGIRTYVSCFRPLVNDLEAFENPIQASSGITTGIKTIPRVQCSSFWTASVDCSREAARKRSCKLDLGTTSRLLGFSITGSNDSSRTITQRIALGIFRMFCNERAGKFRSEPKLSHWKTIWEIICTRVNSRIIYVVNIGRRLTRREGMEEEVEVRQKEAPPTWTRVILAIRGTRLLLAEFVTLYICGSKEKTPPQVKFSGLPVLRPMTPRSGIWLHLQATRIHTR